MQFLRNIFSRLTADPQYPLAEVVDWLFENVRTTEGDLLTEEAVVAFMTEHSQQISLETLTALRRGLLPANGLTIFQRRALAAAFNVPVRFLDALRTDGTLSEIYAAYLEQCKELLCPNCGAQMLHVRSLTQPYICIQCDPEGSEFFKGIMAVIRDHRNHQDSSSQAGDM